jgi:hypothetical protein
MLINNLLFVFGFLFFNAVAIPAAQSHSLTPRDNGSIVVTVSADPGGAYKLAFSENGVTQGYLVENIPNSSYPYHFIVLDASGVVIDPKTFVNDRDSGIPPQLMQLASVTQQFGQAAWDFFKCIGWGAAMACLGYFYSCLTTGTLPWFCDTGLACVVVYGVTALKTCIDGATGQSG